LKDASVWALNRV